MCIIYIKMHVSYAYLCTFTGVWWNVNKNQRIIKSHNWGCLLLMIVKMNWKFDPHPSDLSIASFCMVGKTAKSNVYTSTAIKASDWQIKPKTQLLLQLFFKPPKQVDCRPIHSLTSCCWAVLRHCPSALYLSQPVPSPSPHQNSAHLLPDGGTGRR